MKSANRQKLSAFRQALSATSLRANPRKTKTSAALSDALQEMARRFLLVDPKDVTDTDLVAVLLAGAVEGDPTAAAAQLLSEVQNNVARVVRAEGFARRAGFSTLAHARMAAASELVRRAERRAAVEGLGDTVTGAAAAYRVARAFVGGPTEQVGALFFDRRLRLLGFRILSTGAQSYSIIDPREVVITALEMRANSVILVHNHPSGEPDPSKADDQATEKVYKALKSLDMDLVDHIILGRGDETYSYTESGRLNVIAARHNPSTARRTHPALWERVKTEVTASSKGGRPGQWSARKAQFAVAEYKARGGGYVGPKTPDNSLVRWTKEEWRTRSGLPSLETGERYLPTRALAALTAEEYAATSKRKRAGMRRGQQFVPQPESVAMKTAKYRRNGPNPRTVTQVTKAAREALGDPTIELQRGEEYFYVLYGKYGMTEGFSYGCRVSDFPMDRWIRDIQEAVEEDKK